MKDLELLLDLRNYMRDRADADHNGIDYVPNEEMKLLARIEAELEGLTTENKTEQ